MSQRPPLAFPVPSTVNRAFWEQRQREMAHRVVPGGRVEVLPGPNETVRIVGLSSRGKWIAEFACLEVDFKPEMVTRMERHVMRSAVAPKLTAI